MKKTIISLLICASYLLCTTTAIVNAQVRTSSGYSSSDSTSYSGHSEYSGRSGSSSTSGSNSGRSGSGSTSGSNSGRPGYSGRSGSGSGYSGRSGSSSTSDSSSSSESNTSTATKPKQFKQDVNVFLETNESGRDIYAKVTLTYEQHNDGTLEIVGLHFYDPQDWSVYNKDILNNNQDLEIKYHKSNTDKYVNVVIYSVNANPNNTPYTVHDKKPKQIKQDVNILLETDKFGHNIYAKLTVTYEQHDDGSLEAVHVHFSNPQDWYVYNKILLNNNQNLEVTYHKNSTDKYVTKVIYAYNAKFYY